MIPEDVRRRLGAEADGAGQINGAALVDMQIGPS